MAEDTQNTRQEERDEEKKKPSVIKEWWKKRSLGTKAWIIVGVVILILILIPRGGSRQVVYITSDVKGNQVALSPDDISAESLNRLYTKVLASASHYKERLEWLTNCESSYPVEDGWSDVCGREVFEKNDQKDHVALVEKYNLRAKTAKEAGQDLGSLPPNIDIYGNPIP